MLRDEAPQLLEGVTEHDELFVGGREGWKHKSKRTPKSRGRSTKTKTPVLGSVQRGGPTRFKVVEDTKAETLQSEIVPNVKPGSTINTDEWIGYRGLDALYQHEVVRHKEGEYVRGSAYSNTIENRFSHFRRTLVGTYHQVSKKHLQRYADESSFRLSTFELEAGERFDLALEGLEGSLPYADLVSAPEWCP